MATSGSTLHSPRAYEGLADTSHIMVFINGYPLEQVGWAGQGLSEQ